ncbi:MAG: NupC/NupG family nucleoside CNT transporter [candidate division KSB1 bacterium]|nr:NupC/NupG family nucleoside CNT transporter [candidate division KSB1 bacterium]MDZ7334601.1 NupC/NupG family nucleoside CNT transporter [candidate division KSB1 bacterium]MDZ7356592.1 NupC/NupG family nucleoside CNT transporter [candidate division KSB1 bacterium]MDZ7377466.1 NupC/NupG family nucleoside CNT transporter [candidate division KSB1 bacterium]MDZ7399909.1 NupC/NupG family nucleoside CNT transporter [candidate division KSB1 bacterium]
MWVQKVTAIFGIFVLLGIAWLLSNNKKRLNFRVIIWGLALQLLFAVLILKTGPGQMVFFFARAFIAKLLSFTDAGASFLFGNLYRGDPGIIEQIGGAGPLQLRDGITGQFIDVGIVFAFHILPTIIFFASLMSVLYHLGIMQKIVQFMAWIMAKSMGTSGAESLSAAGNIFVGQTEAPLLVRPYVPEMTHSELMAIMVGGFATIAGGVMAAYVRFGIDAGHLMAASVMSAPAALVMAKIIYPETEEPKTRGLVKLPKERTTANVIDAAASGAADGLRLALNVGAMLMAFIALIAMINYGLGKIDDLINFITFHHTQFNWDLSLKKILGVIFSPLAFFLGVTPRDLLHFGNLLGTKISINEMIAYIDLVNLKGVISERSYIIATYALCGFANFSSIAIQIGGIGGIAPERRSDLARIGLKAMIGGALASWLTAAIAGILI